VGFVERSDDSRANERVAGDSDKKKERMLRIGWFICFAERIHEKNIFL
jgi:hypothetical protein